MKFHLSFSFLIFLVLAIFSKVIQTYLIIFFILLIHELGHLGAALYFNYKISDMYIYPFGFSATIHHLNHAFPYEIIIIMICGLGMHLIFIFVLNICGDFHLFSSTYTQYLLHINYSILLFNLLPIYPLDGARILFALLRLFLSYSLSKYVIFILSLLCLLYFMIVGSISMKIILVFLFIILIKEIRKSLYDDVDYSYYKEKYLKVV